MAERMLQHAPAGIESGKLGREVLAQYMHTFDELAEQYRKTDETKFRQYAELAVACAKALAPYQSPTYRAIVLSPPPPPSETVRRFTLRIFDPHNGPALPPPDDVAEIE